MEFVKVAETPEITTGRLKLVSIKGTEILITNIDGKYYAIGNKCTHAGGDLSKGNLEGNVIVCPKHGVKFDVTTGKAVFFPKYWIWQLKAKDEPSYQVKVDGNSILVKH